MPTIRDHARKIANFGLQFFALLSRCPEVRAHALPFLFELPFEFGQGGHRAAMYASQSKAIVAKLTRWYPGIQNRDPLSVETAVLNLLLRTTCKVFPEE